MTELVYRDGRVEKLWSGYGLVSDGDVLHIGTSWGPVYRRRLADIAEVRIAE